MQDTDVNKLVSSNYAFADDETTNADGHFGTKLAPSWPKLAPSWSQVGPSWPKWDPSWPHVGSKLAPRAKKNEPSEQRSGREQQRDENYNFKLQLGVKKVASLDAKWCGSIFKNASPADTGLIYKETISCQM